MNGRWRELASPTQRANRRRLLVFLGVFLLASVVSLAYTFGRPAEYRAAARVQINPGAMQVEAIRQTGGSQGTDAPRPFLTELQVLTSRPVLEAAAERLSALPGDKVAALGADPIASMQSALTASPAGGTDVVELAATGPDPEFVAALVNTVIGTYKDRLEQSYQEASGESVAQLDDEVAKLEARVAEKRRAVEDFRVRNNVVSLEREENEVLARVRGQSTALNNANEKLAAAEGKLEAVTAAAAEGKGVVRAKDNPTLANLEQRASQIREELRDLERSYTPDYLALDNRVRAQRTRLAELERQIAIERKTAQESALAEAREDAASAREAVNRIQRQMASDRGAVQAFSTRFNEYKVMREELAQLESLQRDTLQRKVRLEAGERARRPSVKIVEAAAVPRDVWRPLYLRDAAISVVGSLLLALLAMWLVELFNRADPQPTVLVAQPMPYPVGGGLLGGGYGDRPALAGGQAPALAGGPSALLPSAPTVPRELVPEEIRSLLAAAGHEVQLATLLLLGGLSLDEVLALRWDDIDLATRRIRVGRDAPRSIEIVEPLLAMLHRSPGSPDARVLAAVGEAPPTVETLASQLLYAAHDGGLERAAEVTPDALWHTGVAFLARQGIRLADLAKVAGRLSAEQAATYSALAPTGTRVSLAEVRSILEQVREPDAA